MTERITEDKLLKELGDLARREQEAELALLDERWDRLADGTLSAEEDAALRALAETSPLLREVYEAFQPLGADFEARVTEAIRTKSARGPAPEPETSTPEPEEPPAPLLPFRRGVSRPLAWIGSLASAAAVLLFFFRSPTVPLPVYTAKLEGGAQEMRGGEPVPASGLPIFTTGSLLTLTAQPAKTVEGPVKARAFFGPHKGRGDLHPLDAAPEIAESGSVRLRGHLGREIQIPDGLWTIWIVVGRRGGLPSADELGTALRAGRTQGDGWQAVSRNLRIDGRAPP